jgi:hypothetical protein
MTGVVGVYVSGETVTGGTSAATATVVSFNTTTDRLVLKDIVNVFEEAETFTGGTSGATGTFDSLAYSDNFLTTNEVQPGGL